MKISIIASPYWPIPSRYRTGDLFYIQLANTLGKFGNDVSLFAPEGTIATYCTLYPMTCSFGAYNNGQEEEECFNKFSDVLYNQDIIHDFSASKKIAEILFEKGYKNVISTHLGGAFKHPNPSHNIVAQSYSQKNRILQQINDYSNTPLFDLDTSTGIEVNDVSVVYNGIDTNFFTPKYNKQDYFLWFGRWHPVRGYKFAIELAKKSGIKLIMMGTNPDDEQMECLKHWGNEAIDQAKDIKNINFEWLPIEDNQHNKIRLEIIRNAKALIQPTQFNEPFGLTQPEALACATPIITTNYGSMPEIVMNGMTGYITNNTIEDFITAINKIDEIDNRVCREDAVRRFDLTVMAANYIKQYRRVICQM